MKKKYILDAVAILPNNELVMGPIVTSDDDEYLFVNKHSDLDFYLTLKKGENGWYQSGGPEIRHPQPIIDELGYQIDKFLVESPILSKIDLSNGSDKKNS